jgi:hypothetical protein
MAAIEPRYTHEEFRQRGNEWYERQIRPIEEQHRGSFVAIDIESGGYEIDANELNATKRLSARLPDAQIWLRRIGYSYLHHLGPGRRTRSS